MDKFTEQQQTLQLQPGMGWQWSIEQKEESRTWSLFNFIQPRFMNRD
jgi:hypothetical protein